jgi:hypothetical protein
VVETIKQCSASSEMKTGAEAGEHVHIAHFACLLAYRGKFLKKASSVAPRGEHQCLQHGFDAAGARPQIVSGSGSPSVTYAVSARVPAIWQGPMTCEVDDAGRTRVLAIRKRNMGSYSFEFAASTVNLYF